MMNQPEPFDLFPNDSVCSPEHYRKLDVEAIDMIEMSMTQEEFLGYLKGNVQKYLIRYKHKGKPLEDLDKALWYLTKLRYKVSYYEESEIKHDE